MVPVLDNFFPNSSVAHLVAQASPLLSAKGVFALVRLQLDDRIQYGKVQAPDLDARGP